MGGARREVDEGWLAGHQRFLLVDPGDGSVGQVLGQVVALVRAARRVDRRDPLVQGRVSLVGAAADEAVEVLEATAGGPYTGRAVAYPLSLSTSASGSAAGEQRGAGWRAQRRGMKPGQFQRRRPAVPSPGCGTARRTRWTPRTPRRRAGSAGRWAPRPGAGPAAPAGRRCPGPSRHRWSARHAPDPE